MNSKVGILPYARKPGFNLAKVPLQELEWPLDPDANYSGTIADLTPDDHLIVQPNSHTLYLPRPGVKCNVSTWIREPRSVHRRHFFWLRFIGARFHRIFTYNAEFLAQVKNARYCMSGTTWIKNPEKLVIQKTEMTSLIASKKRDLEGHNLRHQTADWAKHANADIKVLGSGYQRFGPKEDGLAPFRFSVVTENSAEQGYISEKLIDCLICKTVPLYWGAPDVGRHFDISGLIICNSFEDIVRELQNLTIEKYDGYKAVIEKNHATALRLANLRLDVANALISEGGSRQPRIV